FVAALLAMTCERVGYALAAKLKRRVARDGDAVHAPALAVIIVERAVLGAAVVPDGERIGFPAEAAGELRLHRVRHEEIEDRPGFGAGKTVERLGVVADVERLAAGFRMGAHERMGRFR